MKPIKKIKIFIGALAAVAGTFFIVKFAKLLFSWIWVIFALLLMILGLIIIPNPPKPEITYGEFPFTLTYEVDGEIKVIEDTLICEFDGFTERSTAGVQRKWETTLKSGKEHITLLDLRSSNYENEFNDKILELYLSYGGGAYYMGDTENYLDYYGQSLDLIEYMCQTKDGKISYGGYKPDEAFEKYKIRLIGWECAPPIENNFKYKTALGQMLFGVEE